MRSPILPLLLAITACAPATNGTVGDDSDLLPASETTVMFGRCARTSWVSGPLAADGKRHTLACDQVGVGYLARRAGYTDTTVSVLQKDEAVRIELRALWESRERLVVHFVKLGDGEEVHVRGECKGVFVRPPDSAFEPGTQLEHDDEPPTGKSIDCTVTDLQGHPIGAISFTSR